MGVRSIARAITVEEETIGSVGIVVSFSYRRFSWKEN
jgi:hypothetical protein